MKLHPFSEQEMAAFGSTHWCTIDYTDLVALANGNTGTVNIGTTNMIQANNAVVLNFYRAVTLFTFSDATILSNAVTIGDTGSATRYLSSTETCGAAASPVYVKAGALAPNAFNVYSAQDTLQAAFTGTAGKNINTATAGQILLAFTIRDGRTGYSLNN